MAKKRSTAATSVLGSRAWRRLRLAVLWIRKGGAFNHGAFVFERLKPRRALPDKLYYVERQFSFEKTPLFQFRAPSMWIRRIPCITPADGGFFSDEDDAFFFGREYKTKNNRVPAGTGGEDEADDAFEVESLNGCEEEDEGIDVKAEVFIAKFYQQMRLQRQVSLLQ